MNIRILRVSDLKDIPFRVLEPIETKHHNTTVYALRCRDGEGEFYIPLWSGAYKIVCKALSTNSDVYWTVDVTNNGVPYIKQINRKEAVDLIKRQKTKQEK